MDETYRVPMRLSAVLGLLPLLSGSTCTSRGVQTAMDLVDKARMDEELEQCYEVLDRNIEYYHAWKPGRTTASSADEPGETEDGYRTATFRGDDAERRWNMYNQRVCDRRGRPGSHGDQPRAQLKRGDAAHAIRPRDGGSSGWTVAQITGSNAPRRRGSTPHAPAKRSADRGSPVPPHKSADIQT